MLSSVEEMDLAGVSIIINSLGKVNNFNIFPILHAYKDLIITRINEFTMYELLLLVAGFGFQLSLK
jgi:hypothetical protein